MAFKQIVIILAIAIASGSALKCYTCIGIDEDCEDAVELECETLNPTDNQLPKNLKAVQRFPELNDTRLTIKAEESNWQCLNLHDSDIIFRGCVPYQENNALEAVCKVIEEKSSSFTCEVCQTDLCNSSYTFVPSFLLLLVSFFLIYFK